MKTNVNEKFGLKVGQILESYDGSYSFYEVLGFTDTKVRLAQIKTDYYNYKAERCFGYVSNVRPAVGENRFFSKPFLRKVNEAKNYVAINSYTWASPYDGRVLEEHY